MVYARVSSAEQKDDLDRQVGWVVEWATRQGCQPDEAVKEIGSGLNGNHRRLRRLVWDHTVGPIVGEHRERLKRLGRHVTCLCNRTKRRTRSGRRHRRVERNGSTKTVRRPLPNADASRGKMVSNSSPINNEVPESQGQISGPRQTSVLEACDQ